MATVPAEIEQPKVPVKAPVASGGKLAAFVPQTLDEAWRLAGAMAASGMTPKAYGPDQNKIMVGIMAGAEVGLTPFAALQSIAVIGNNPSLWGDGALALVQASGLLEDMEESDDGDTATCRLNRKGRSTPIVRTFSMEDAKKAGLADKSGPWSQYPARMRQMRARAFALRDGFPDVLKGLHIVEEVRDYSPMTGGLPAAEPLTAAMLVDQSKSIPEAEASDVATVEAETVQHDPTTGELFDGPTDDVHPGTAIADKIIAEVEAAGAKIDITGIISRYAKDIAALPEEDNARVNDAIGARKTAIDASREASDA